MDNLGIIDLYEKNADSNRLNEFVGKTDSTLRVEMEKKEATLDTEWIDVIEQTIPYIDNIFRAPNRFIVNEEEVVKVEQAKKITIETIKHLSKNTNLIQAIDEKGEVTPSKLLNVRKEESYDTYENRLIYTLIQNAKMFIKRKKEELMTNINIENSDNLNKNNKTLEYNATSKIKDEKISIKLNLNSNLDFAGDISKEKIAKIMDRIEAIEKKLQMLGDSEPYQIIDKQHISLVREPIKKTNVVLKNVNFQYAMKLWSYLRDNYNGSFTDEEEENKNYIDNGELKQFVDETFLLQYLAMKTLDEDNMENEITQQQIQQNMVEQMIEKMVDMDVEITEQQLKQMISNKYEVVKYKKTEIIKEIQQIFKTHIEKYEKQIEQRRK